MIVIKQCLFDFQFKYMKRSANKSAVSTGKLKPTHSQISTGINSQHRSQVHSLIRQRDQNDKPEASLKTKQLFAIIETFYSTLCDLPLEKLISSAEPETWIQEQEETLRSLEGKLRATGKEKNQQYYRFKLRSIETIIGNIRDNLAMLKRMSELKNYCSGTQSSSYMSHRASSFDHSSKAIRLGQFASDSASIQQIKEMLNYDEYALESSSLPKSANSGGPEMMAQTVNSEIQSSEEEEETLAKSDMIDRQKAKKRMATREGENMDTSNRSKCGNKSNKQQELKDKTLTKVQASSKSQLMTNKTTQNRYKGLHLSNEETKRSQIMQGNSSTFSHPIPPEYLELIKELRLELLQKDQQIERLLINQQEFEQTVEIYQNRQKEKATEILFLKENITIHEREKEKMQAEIRRLNAETEELRDTVRFERERCTKEEAQRLKAESALQTAIEEKKALYVQINDLRNESEACCRNERKMKQSQDIYTRKYFQLVSTCETHKQQMRSLQEEVRKQRERNRAEEVCDSVKRIVDRHKQRIFLQS